MAERLVLVRQPPERVLDWSLDGGGMSPALRQALPRAQFVRLVPGHGEASPAPSWWSRLKGAAVRAPSLLALDAVEPGAHDLVWSCMALHFENDPPALFRRWREALRADGFVMFSTLGPGSLSGLRELYAQQSWGPAHAPFVDMHDLGDMMVEAGFAGPVMDQEVLTLTYAEPQSLLRDLRAWGRNLAPQRFPGCRTPRWRDSLLQALGARRDASGRIQLALELVHGHAFRAPDRGPAVAPVTTVALSAMKLMLRKSGSGN
ncbi:MAG: methyltransferase domain-containing protein [Ideonella sp.]